MSRRRDPISEEGASYQKVLTGLKGLHQRLHDLSAARQQLPSVAPEILQSFDTAITELEDELQTMGTGVLHSPFVDLASRTARIFSRSAPHAVSRNGFSTTCSVKSEPARGGFAFSQRRVRGRGHGRAQRPAPEHRARPTGEPHHHPRDRCRKRLRARRRRSSDELLANEESAQQLELRSVLAIPLRFKDYLAGCIYLENQRASGAFGEKDLEFLRALGRLTAVFLNAPCASTRRWRPASVCTAS